MLLKRLGGGWVAKTQYLYSLLSCGVYDSQLENLYQHEDQQPKNLTLEQCHNFIMPLLRTNRRFNVSKEAAGRGVDENAPGAKPDSSADVLPVRALNGDRSNRAEQRGRSPEHGQGGGKRLVSDPGLPPCTHCGKAHNPKYCRVGSSTFRPKWLKDQRRVGESDVKERLKFNLCVWCGKKRHKGTERCHERKPRTGNQGQDPQRMDVQRSVCKGCGKPGHSEDTCWNLHPELKRRKP